ncbi:pep a2 [Streptomyces phaeochromogenes]|uniref:pep a2 n=1 Tax=Streptomyces phaeochromogenes TaxID=1923 RepID=UPI0022534A01|nr:pep a2 [Streptomyces phaeochromogenes]MCX5599592.1 pep a2 [Streptomyces phaeochromogenes]
MKTVVPCYYHLDVEVSPERVDQVRRILAAHLRYWNLENLVEPVCHCADVLLRSIGEHAADKNTTIEMWWNGQHLITAVADNDGGFHPESATPGWLARIAALSDGWGCCGTDTGGKIVWFSRRARAIERAPLVPAGPAPSLREARRTPREMPVPAMAFSTPVGSFEGEVVAAASG